MERTAPEGVWQYKASWRSSQGHFTILLLLVTAVIAFFAFASLRNHAVFPWLFTALFAWFTWLAGKPLFTGEWVLRIGPRGVTGAILNQRTIPWRDVRDVEVQVVQGYTTIVLAILPGATETLAKTRRRRFGRKPERRIPLSALDKQQIIEATDAARATFAQRGGDNARAAEQARFDEVQAEAAFIQELAQRTPVAKALYAIVALNVAAWLWNVGSGMSPVSPSAADLFRWGGNSAWAVVNEHQYWRLLTATFLHGGLMHLVMNMLGLWGAGKLLNRMLGNGQFVLVYLASALAGSATSLHFSAQGAVSVGASGAVFGVISALVVTGRLRRERLPQSVRKQIFTGQGVFLFYALINGFAHRGVDNAAHVGGLLAGAAMAVLLTRGVQGVERKLPWRPAVAGLCAAAAVFALVVGTPPPPVDHRALFSIEPDLRAALAKMQEAARGMQADIATAKAGGMTEPQLADRLERVHLPALRVGQAELQKVQVPPGDPRAAFAAEMRAMAANSVEGCELMVRIARGQGTPEAEARVAMLKRELELGGERVRAMGAAAKKRP